MIPNAYHTTVWHVTVARLLAVLAAFAVHDLPQLEAASPIAHVSPVANFAFISGGKYLVTSSTDGEMFLWDCQQGRIVRRLSHEGELANTHHVAHHFAVDPIAHRVAVNKQRGSRTSLQVFPAHDPLIPDPLVPDPLSASWTTTSPANPIQFTHDGKFVFAWGHDSDAEGFYLWNADNGELSRSPQKPSPADERVVAQMLQQFGDDAQQPQAARRQPEIAGAILGLIHQLSTTRPDGLPLVGDTVGTGFGVGVQFSPGGHAIACRYWGDTGSSVEEVSIWKYPSGQLLHKC
ncbi:MAG: hypothetical protein R3E01_24995 [Pirellulaceae bacterium]|nr:hypothetical protein [Planctomycetales bacterium]